VLRNLNLQISYTYSDYKYTSSAVDPLYTDPVYVLTAPPAAEQWLPNSPKNQLYSEVVYSVTRKFKVSVGSEYQSKWAIYTDAKAYSGALDPSIYQNWQKGLNLFNASVTYNWNILGMKGEFSLSARNLTGATYMAFTEPDPDGNAYQPGPSREIFGTIKIEFNRK
jgi:outer membrane receptor for monomeric catechols